MLHCVDSPEVLVLREKNDSGKKQTKKQNVNSLHPWVDTESSGLKWNIMLLNFE